VNTYNAEHIKDLSFFNKNVYLAFIFDLEVVKSAISPNYRTL